MPYQIDIQNTTNTPLNISEQQMIEFANIALQSQIEDAELTIRIVDEDEIQQLNNTYRHKNKPTNVLAFPSQIPKDILNELDFPYIGDIIICASIIEKESFELNKSSLSHWAHILIHGVLHLLGYDHMEPEEEKKMQQVEIELLKSLGISNPYEENGL